MKAVAIALSFLLACDNCASFRKKPESSPPSGPSSAPSSAPASEPAEDETVTPAKAKSCGNLPDVVTFSVIGFDEDQRKVVDETMFLVNYLFAALPAGTAGKPSPRFVLRKSGDEWPNASVGEFGIVAVPMIPPFGGARNVLGLTIRPDEGAARTTILIRSDLYGGYLQITLLHELGHAFGVDHSPKEDDVMFHSVNPLLLGDMKALERWRDQVVGCGK